MARTQIQFTETQIQGLRRLSAETGRSVADLTRDAVDRLLAAEAGSAQEIRIRRGLEVAGAFSSGSADGSSDHDRHLTNAFS